MGLIALLVEGKTEWIFFSHLLPYISLPDRLFVSKHLVNILDNKLHENKIWLQDCQGDRSIPTFIKKNINVFLQNKFEKLILIRDYYPDNRLPINLCKKDLCRKLLENIPISVVSRYSNNIFINLSVEEIEAWFFSDKHMFERMKPNLTEDYINTNYDDILTINPEEIKHPSSKLIKIIKREVPGHKYNKTEKEIYFVISKLDINACLRVMNKNYVQSLNRIIEYLMQVL